MIELLKGAEGFSSKISRLYPTNEEIKTNSKACRELTFQITENCNLNCSYCYQSHKSINKMSFDIAKKMVDLIFKDNEKINTYYDRNNLKALVLDFIGGEPLLEIDFIDKVMDYYVKTAYEYKSDLAYKYMISICTNGVLYNTEKVQKFIKKWEPKLSLNISVDGCKELHDACRVFHDGSGSYDIVEKAVKTELIRNPKLSTKMTLAPQNIKYFLPAIKNLTELGYTNIPCNYVFEKGWTIQDARDMYYYAKETADYLLSLEKIPDVSYFEYRCGLPTTDLPDRNWCGGNGQMLAVNYKGDLYPCLRFMESSVGYNVEPYIIGNVFDGIRKTPDQIKKLNCLSCITRTSQSPKECIDCGIASGCSWCTAYNYQEFGTPNKRTTYICDMHKARVLANSYFWNILYRKLNSSERFKINLSDEKCLEIISKDELNLLKDLERD